MQALTFKRGVHPDDCKRFSADKPIEVILPKENSEMFYPMSQHIGAPCEPIVAVGDYGLAGSAYVLRHGIEHRRSLRAHSCCRRLC